MSMNASIFGFLSQDKIAAFKKLLGNRFIAVADFPDGVPWCWQDKKLHLTSRSEPICHGVFANFGIRNLRDEAEALEILTQIIPVQQIFRGEILPPEFWSIGISEKFNEESA